MGKIFKKAAAQSHSYVAAMKPYLTAKLRARRGGAASIEVGGDNMTFVDISQGRSSTGLTLHELFAQGLLQK